MAVEYGDAEAETLQALVENTREGWHSRIGYVKANGSASERVIEPMRLVECSTGILVHSVQVEPKTSSPFRSFRLDRISSVSSDQRPIDPARLRTNNLITGEVHEVRATRERRVARGAVAGARRTPFVRAHGEWLIEYVPIVRAAVADLRITNDERHYVEEAQIALNLGPAQIAAAHALVFAEDAMACALDGGVSDAEAEYLCHLNGCLKELGWAPVSV